MGKNVISATVSALKSQCEGAGTLLTGLGTLLIGVAACVALFQTNGILDKILEIKKAIEALEKGNQNLQQSTNNIQQMVNELNKRTKANTAIEVSKQIGPLKTLSEKAAKLKEILPTDQNRAVLKAGEAYLPHEKFNEVLEKSDVAAQQAFLKDNLKIWEPQDKK